MLKVTEDAFFITLETDRSPVESVDNPAGVSYVKRLEIPKHIMLAMIRRSPARESYIVEDGCVEYFFAPPSLSVGGISPGDIHGPTFGAIVGNVVTMLELTEIEFDSVMSVVDGIEER